MIDVKVEDVEKGKELSFPCLMIATDGVIILARSRVDVSNIKGTVIGGTGTIGMYSESWSAIYFKPLNGSITLRNKD